MSRFIKPKSSYVIVPNIAIRDKRLKMSSRFMWAFLCNLPDDWNYSIVGLASAVGCGEKAIRTAIRELEYYGYLERVQQRDGNKFGPSDYLLIENPNNQMPVQKSSAYKGDDENRATATNGDDDYSIHNKTNNYIKQETILNNNSKQKKVHTPNLDVAYGNNQGKTSDTTVNSIQELCPEAYNLCNEIGIEIKVADSMYSIIPHDLFMDYLQFTIHAVKNSTIHNPTGFFIDAIKKQYDIQPRLNTGGVAKEIIEKTEQDMQEQYERELATTPPVSVNSPFYKYCQNKHAVTT